MARISIYSQDSDLNIADKVLGTDSTTNTTKNFSLGSIFDLANEIGAVNIFDGAMYKFTTYVAGASDPQGVINLNTTDTANVLFAGVTEIFISIKDSKGNNLEGYLDNTLNDYIKLAPLDDLNTFGIYEVIAIADHDTAYKRLTVVARGSNGSISANTEYFLSNMGVNSAATGGSLTEAGVVDTLVSVVTNRPLSANQGRVLKELADTKVAAEAGKSLSTNDFTTVLLNKLNAIPSTAEENVQSDWSAVTGDSAILNKPAIPAAQINSDWNQTNTAIVDFINNKPTDITDLSTHAATELNDITSAGSGSIITGVERTKLNNIADGANVNVQADYTALTGDSFIQNKPTIVAPEQSDYTEADATSLAHILNKPDLLAIGTTGTTALAGNTTLLGLGTTAGTALAGNTALLGVGTVAGTALEGDTLTISTLQAQAIATNSGKNTFPGFGTTTGTSLEGDTALLAIGTTGTTALAGDTTTISTLQATAIGDNSAKITFPGIGTTAGTALAGNTTTITTIQANNISTNNDKAAFPGFGATAGTALEGDTTLLGLGTTAGTALAGDTVVISTEQATAISTNSNKAEFPGFGTVNGTALQGDTALLAIGTSATTALAGDTTVISTVQATAISNNSNKNSFPGFGTTAGTSLEGNTTIVDGGSTVTLTGTANEIEVTGAAQAISADMTFTVGLPDSITVTNDVIADNAKLESTVEFTGVEATAPSFDNGLYFKTEETHDTLHFRYDGNDLSIDHLTENVPTGILEGGLLSTNTNTTFDLSAGNGVINDLNKGANSNPHPEIKQVSWVDLTAIPHAHGAIGNSNQLTTYVYVDANGVIQQQLATPNDNLWRSSIVIGVIVHAANVISSVKSFPRPGYSSSNTVNDFITTFGALKKSGHDVTANGANLGLNRSAGVTFALGRNYANNAEDASTVVDSAKVVAILHRYRTNNAGGHIIDDNSGNGHSDVDGTKYDVGNGTLAAVADDKFTAQKMFFFPGNVNNIAIYYGKAFYNTLQEAEVGYLSENFKESDYTATQAIYLGVLIVKSNTSDLSLISDAKVINGGIFRNLAGSAGGGVNGNSLLGDLQDVTVAGVTNNQTLRYNNTSGQWENVTLDADTLTEGTTNLYYTEARVTANTTVSDNSNKVSFPGFGTTTGTALEGDTTLLAIGTTSTTALAGDTTVISTAQATAIGDNSNKTSFPGFGTTTGTSLEGDTALLALGNTSTTALAGDTSLLAVGTTAGTALEGNTATISTVQAQAITTNSGKAAFPGFGTTTGTSLEGDTALLAIGTTGTTALAGNTTTISTVQATAIGDNSNKTTFPGFGTANGTALQGDTVTISTIQSSAITTNSGKAAFPGFGTAAGSALEGDTSLLALGTTATTALQGDTVTISTAQTTAIGDNSNKVSFPGLGTTAGTALAGDTALLEIGTTTGTALEGDTTTISTAQATAIGDNSAKITFPGFGTTAATALAGNTALLALGTSATTALAGDTAFVDGTGTANAIPLFSDSDTLADSPLSVDANSNVSASGTGSFKVPAGLPGQRPATPVAGMIRYNSTSGSFEGYTSQWDSIGGSSSTIQKNTFSADGTNAAFTISTAILDIKNINVFIDGVYQFESTYSSLGAVVTFDTAPPVGTNNIQVVHTLANVVSFVGKAVSITEANGTATLDFQAADVFNLTIDEATTLTFDNPQLANTKNIVITGDFAVTLPNSVREVSGGSATATGATLIQVTCVDATTPVYYATIATA